MNRRKFLSNSAVVAAGIGMSSLELSGMSGRGRTEPFFSLSLAEWSLHRTLFSGELTNLDFPAYARKKFNIHAVEYVNQFFPSAKSSYTNKLLQRCMDEDVKSLLIMVDGEGNLGELYRPKRLRAVEKHYPWVEAAKNLGCHSIRVNAGGNGSKTEVARAATESLQKLSEFATDYGLNVIVENHGGYSSNAEWLTAVIKGTGMENCGTLPDFGNFRISNTENYDKYKGVSELMPFAKGVSAKSHDFDLQGNETGIDYYRMLDIVRKAGYKGYIGIEYEGKNLSEEKGIMATRKLLLKAGEPRK